jgi:putative peptidoglycan lipid II flippase
MAASWVLLPELSKLAVDADHERLRLKMQQSISGIAMVAIPAAIAIFVLGGTAVQVLFQHGRFDSDSTQRVSRIWMGYTCGLVPLAVGMVPVRLLNAMRQNQFLVQLGAIAATINAGLDYLLMRWLGPVGISLSTSLVYLCSSILILHFVRKLVPGIVDGKFWAGILRALLVCAPAGAALWMFRQAVSGVTALVVGGLLFVGIIYAVYLWLGLVQVPLKKLRTVAAQ